MSPKFFACRIHHMLSIGILGVLAGCSAEIYTPGEEVDDNEDIEPSFAIGLAEQAINDCTVSKVCSSGTTVSCNGTNNQCFVNSNGVTCNGRLRATAATGNRWPACWASANAPSTGS